MGFKQHHKAHIYNSDNELFTASSIAGELDTCRLDHHSNAQRDNPASQLIFFRRTGSFHVPNDGETDQTVHA